MIHQQGCALYRLPTACADRTVDVRDGVRRDNNGEHDGQPAHRMQFVWARCFHFDFAVGMVVIFDICATKLGNRAGGCRTNRQHKDARQLHPDCYDQPDSHDELLCACVPQLGFALLERRYVNAFRLLHSFGGNIAAFLRIAADRIFRPATRAFMRYDILFRFAVAGRGDGVGTASTEMTDNGAVRFVGPARRPVFGFDNLVLALGAGHGPVIRLRRYRLRKFFVQFQYPLPVTRGHHECGVWIPTVECSCNADAACERVLKLENDASQLRLAGCTVSSHTGLRDCSHCFVAGGAGDSMDAAPPTLWSAQVRGVILLHSAAVAFDKLTAPRHGFAHVRVAHG